MREAERMLYRYGELGMMIDECEEAIRETAAKKVGVLDSMLRGTVPNGVCVQEGWMADPVYQAVRQLVDVYDAQIKRETERLRAYNYERDKIVFCIKEAELNKREQRYLDLRYVQRLENRAVAEKMGYEERNIYKIRSNLLKKITRTHTA